MKFTEFIKGFKENTQQTIIELIPEDIDGIVKKDTLDQKILDWTLDKLKEVKLNFIAKIILENLLKKYLPVITQSIYELLKTRVKGL